MTRYQVVTTHDLTVEELARAPKGLKRTSIVVHCRTKLEAVVEYEYRAWFLARMEFSDRLELRDGAKLLRTNEVREG